MPKGITNVNMLTTQCIKCFSRDRREVFKFKLEFDPNIVNEVMSEFLPYDDNTSGEFCLCVGCDN